MSELAGVKIHLPHGSNARMSFYAGDANYDPHGTNNHNNSSYIDPTGEIIASFSEGILSFTTSHQNRFPHTMKFVFTEPAYLAMWLSGIKPDALRFETFGSAIKSQPRFGEFDLSPGICTPGTEPLYYSRYGRCDKFDLGHVAISLFTTDVPEPARMVCESVRRLFNEEQLA